MECLVSEILWHVDLLLDNVPKRATLESLPEQWSSGFSEVVNGKLWGGTESKQVLVVQRICKRVYLKAADGKSLVFDYVNPKHSGSGAYHVGQKVTVQTPQHTWEHGKLKGQDKAAVSNRSRQSKQSKSFVL